MTTTTVRTPCQTNWRPFIAPEHERTSGPSAQARIAKAKSLCHGCFRRLECRDEGRAIGAAGIWGGEDDKQRRKAGVVIVTPVVEPPVADENWHGTDAGARRHRRGGHLPCPECLPAEQEARRQRDAKRQHCSPFKLPRRAPEILQLLADGKTVYEIAELLSLHEGTVYGHIARTRMFLDVPNEHLVATARERGIIPPAPAAVDLTTGDLGVAA